MMKVIPETRRAHEFLYLQFYWRMIHYGVFHNASIDNTNTITFARINLIFLTFPSIKPYI
jgi:hypothetical protein